MKAALLLLLAPLAHAAPLIVIETDPRVELISVVYRLRTGVPARTAYERSVDAWFAPFSKHPAVDLLHGAKDAAPGSITLAVLSLSAPPALAGRVPATSVENLGVRNAVEVVRALRDFAAVSKFQDFYRAHEADYKAFAAQAAAERKGELEPEKILAYTGLLPPAEVRIVLAPILPDSFAVNGESVRVRRASAPVEGRTVFGFNTFGASVAHELAHRLLDPAAFQYRGRMNGPAPASCNGKGASWLACFQEHVVLAVTLRADGKDRVPEMVGRTGDYPLLPAMLDAMKAWEKGRRDFPALYETLVALVPADAAVVPRTDLKVAGLEAFHKGDFEAALSAFESDIAADSGDLDAHMNAGVACQKLGRAPCALAHYGAVIRLTEGYVDAVEEPRFLDALSSRATTLEGLGRKAEARADLERALANAFHGWPRFDETKKRLEALK